MASAAPRLRIRAIEILERPVVMRLPFRFGAVTVRETAQAFVRTLVEVESGGTATGVAAELKVPKWFDKSPALSNADNVAQLDRALALAPDDAQLLDLKASSVAALATATSTKIPTAAPTASSSPPTSTRIVGEPNSSAEAPNTR